MALPQEPPLIKAGGGKGAVRTWPILISCCQFSIRLSHYSRSGAPFDWYLIEDLEEGLLGDYKVYIFLGVFYLSDSQRRAIEKLKADGRTLVWFYAAGFAGQEKL